MIILLDTSHDLDVAADELGCEVGELFTPLTGFNPKRPDGIFAIDNGSFARFDKDAFKRLLEKHHPRRHLCKFVAVPDVVGSARRTLELFDRWHDLIHGWPLALVAQDGQEDLPIPWDLIDAVFIGGSTRWKLGPHAAAVVRTAKALDKWVHVGRVNRPMRFENFDFKGADSADGTGISRHTWMRKDIHDRMHGPTLFGHSGDDVEIFEGSYGE